MINRSSCFIHCIYNWCTIVEVLTLDLRLGFFNYLVHWLGKKKINNAVVWWCYLCKCVAKHQIKSDNFISGVFLLFFDWKCLILCVQPYIYIHTCIPLERLPKTLGLSYFCTICTLILHTFIYISILSCILHISSCLCNSKTRTSTFMNISVHN